MIWYNFYKPTSLCAGTVAAVESWVPVAPACTGLSGLGIWGYAKARKITANLNKSVPLDPEPRLP